MTPKNEEKKEIKKGGRKIRGSGTEVKGPNKVPSRNHFGVSANRDYRPGPEGKVGRGGWGEIKSR